MNLLNFRRGFACNSSSTHSIIKNLDAVTNEFSDFGWSYFKVAPADANLYIAAAVVSDGRKYDLPSMCSVLNLDESSWPSGGYVDHQSHLSMIADPSTGEISAEFVKDLYDWFKLNNAGIKGGNDNDDGPSDWLESEESITAPSPIEVNRLTGRKSGDTWSAIDPQTGTRVRFSFSINPVQTSSPELVDMKITNYCTFGCSYCYQASTKEGSHATLATITAALQDCQAAGVMEIAIGGGEPTMHPQFRQIITTAKKLGVIPNVTTRNLAFIRQVLCGEWNDIGGIAFSVDSFSQVEKICGAIALGAENVGPRITVQIVDQSIRYKSELVRMLDHLKSHRVGVTWLGFKKTGFGKKHIEIKWNQPDWSFVEDVLKREENRYSISVDTAMLSNYSAQLRKKFGEGYDVTATENEGVNSCYIDCCEGVIAKSSYHDDTRRPYQSLLTQFGQVKQPV